MSISNTNPETTDVIRRLRAVTRRIEAFFETQTKKLDEAMRLLNEMQSEYDVARRLSAGLNQQQRSWENDKQEEMQRLSEANQALAVGWQELENKQRDLLLTRMRPDPVHLPRQVQTQSYDSMGGGDAEVTEFEIQLLQRQVNQHTKRSR